MDMQQKEKNMKEVPTDEENLSAQEKTEKQGTRFQKKNGYRER